MLSPFSKNLGLFGSGTARPNLGFTFLFQGLKCHSVVKVEGTLEIIEQPGHSTNEERSPEM